MPDGSKQTYKLLKKEIVISDVEPRSSYDCAVNVVITDKKNGQIRININNIHRNFGNEKDIILCTDTTKNTTQGLNEATIVSEIDMG